MSAPMNMEEWQRRMKAEKEAARKKKTESAEILRGYRGGVNDEELKLRAIREEERRKTMDAQQNLHNYKGIAAVEQTKPKSQGQNAITHPVPVNAGSSSTKDHLAGVDIVAGSVSERAAALAAAAEASGQLPSPTSYQPGLKATLESASEDVDMERKQANSTEEPIIVETKTEIEDASPKPLEGEKLKEIGATEVSSTDECVAQKAACVDDFEEKKESFPVESLETELQISPVANSVAIEDSTPNEKGHADDWALVDSPPTELPPPNVDSASGAQTKPIGTSVDQILAGSPVQDSPEHSPGDQQVVGVEGKADPSPSVTDIPPPPEVLKGPVEETKERDLVVESPDAGIDILETPVEKTEATERSAIVAPLVEDVIRPPPVSTTMDSPGQSTSLSNAPPIHQCAQASSPISPTEGPKRVNVMFSFGVVSAQNDPDLFGYMKAVEKVVARSLENNDGGMRFDPKFRPFVKKTAKDGSFTPRSERSDIKRTLVTAAVPIFYQAPATKPSTKKAVVEALQRCIESGEFLDLAQGS